MKILISQVQWTETVGEPWTQAWLTKLLTHTRNFFLENSDGKVDIEWKVAPFIRMAGTPSPEISAYAPLMALGINPNDYERGVYISPGLAGYGKGYNWGRTSWILGGVDYCYFSLPHELGHSFGFPHAASLQLGETEYIGTAKTLRFSPLDYTTGGSLNGTGDPLSGMGYSGNLSNFSSIERVSAGWITPAIYDGGDRTYDLTAASVRGGALYAVKVPMAMFKSSSTRVYWFERRAQSGFDGRLNTGNCGIVMRVRGDFGAYYGAVIDATARTATYGTSNNPLSDCAFQVGDSFTDDAIQMDVIGEGKIRIRPALVAAPIAAGMAFVIDNLPAGASGVSGDGEVSFTGIWKTQAVQQMRAYKPNSALAAYKSTVPATYTFKTKPLPAGRYDVAIWYPSQIVASAQYCKVVPFTVSGHTGADVTKTFDQRFYGGQWMSHGVYDFAEGAQGVVSVTNGTDVAIADAVRFLNTAAVIDPPVPPPPPPPPPPPGPQAQNMLFLGVANDLIGQCAVDLGRLGVAQGHLTQSQKDSLTVKVSSLLSISNALVVDAV